MCAHLLAAQILAWFSFVHVFYCGVGFVSVIHAFVQAHNNWAYIYIYKFFIGIINPVPTMHIIVIGLKLSKFMYKRCYFLRVALIKQIKINPTQVRRSVIQSKHARQWNLE